MFEKRIKEKSDTVKIKSKRISNIDLELYNRLFLFSEASTPFHSLDFLNVLKKLRKDIILRFWVLADNHRTIAIMPYFTYRFFPVKKKSLLYGCYGGFLYQKEDKELVSDFIKKFSTQYKIVVQDYHNSNLYSHCPFALQHQTWVIDTRINYEEWWAKLHYKTRNQIRKAQSAESIVKDIETKEELKQVLDIYKQLVQKHTIAQPFKDSLFETLFAMSKKGKNIFFKLAKLEKKVIAFSIFLCNQTEVFYWINASDKAFQSYNGTNNILNTMLVHCTHNKDIKRLNMGAVPRGNASLLHFKKRWGAEPVNYYQYSS